MSTQKEQQYPDVGIVREQARAAWFERQRGMLSVQERIGATVPWWIVGFAAVFFLLSVPHTMAVFDKITPVVGRVAPLGVEFGLLYGSFRRKQVGKWTFQLITFELFLFVIAIVVNGAGSFEAVVKSSGNIDNYSMQELVRQYPNLPATSQVALLLAPLAALVIPIGTAVAGEGLATLVLERQRTGNLLEQHWEHERQRVEFEALRDAALSMGLTPGKAVKWAESVTRYEMAAAVGVGHVSDDLSAPGQADKRTSGHKPDGHGTGQGYTKAMDARTRVRTFLEDNPDADSLTVRELAAAVGVGKSTAHEVLGEFKASGNGHKE